MINREIGKELTVLFLQVGLYRHLLRYIMEEIMTGHQPTIMIIGIRILQVQQV